jgi:5-methylcytosine-specific restriction endonuclease McrA
MNKTSRRNTMSDRTAPPSKAAIVEAWKDWLRWEGISLENPCCFACGRPMSSDYKGDDVMKRWENTRLEKAHIVAHSLGGSNEPNNFFLLCVECHANAPTTMYRENFMQWVTAQNFLSRQMGKFMEELEIFLPDPKEREKFMEWMSKYSFEQLKEMLRDRQEEFTQHGGSIPMSTWVAMLVRIWRETTS